MERFERDVRGALNANENGLADLGAQFTGEHGIDQRGVVLARAHLPFPPVLPVLP